VQHHKEPNKVFIVSAGQKASAKGISCWDAHTGKLARQYKGHKHNVTALCAFGPGKFISAAQSIKLWDLALETEKPITSFTGQKGVGIYALCLLNSGLLATGNEDGSITLYSARTGKLTHRLLGHSGYVTTLCLGPNNTLLSGGSDRSLCVWDLTTNSLRQTIRSHSARISTIVPITSTTYASGGWDSTVQFWTLNKATNKLNRERKMKTIHLNSKCNSLLYLDSRQLLLSGSAENTIDIWNPFTRTRVNVLDNGFGEGQIESLLPVPSFGEHVISSTHQGHIRVWNSDKVLQTIF
jgi:WD40 repeat protein